MLGLLRPKLIAAAALSIAALLLVSLVSEMNRRLHVQREVNRLQREVAALQKGVVELQNLNQYFNTDDFQERLAREKLNYRAPNERVVLIPEDSLANAPVAEPVVSADSRSIPLKWWYVLFVPTEP